MLKASLCDYSDSYILVKGTISIAAQAGDNTNNGNKEVIFKNFVPFTDCVSEINNIQIDNAKEIGVLIPMYSLIEYSNNYSKTSGSLLKYYRYEQTLTDTGTIANFHDANNSTFLNLIKKTAER